MLRNSCTYFVFLLLVLAAKLPAQNTASEWLQKSNEVLDSASHVKVDLTMKVIAGGLTGELLETNTGTYKKAGSNTYTSFGPMISVQKGDKSILVDKLNSSIYYMEASKTPTTNYLTVYSQLKKYIDTLYIAANNDNYVDIVCKYKTAMGVMYSRIDTRVNKRTKLPEMINLFMNDGMPFYEEELKGRKPLISIDYKNWQLNATGDISQFEFEKYIVKQNGVWTGVGEYKNYEITTLY